MKEFEKYKKVKEKQIEQSLKYKICKNRERKEYAKSAGGLLLGLTSFVGDWKYTFTENFIASNNARIEFSLPIFIASIGVLYYAHRKYTKSQEYAKDKQELKDKLMYPMKYIRLKNDMNEINGRFLNKNYGIKKN